MKCLTIYKSPWKPGRDPLQLSTTPHSNCLPEIQACHIFRPMLYRNSTKKWAFPYHQNGKPIEWRGLNKGNWRGCTVRRYRFSIYIQSKICFDLLDILYKELVLRIITVMTKTTIPIWTVNWIVYLLHSCFILVNFSSCLSFFTFSKLTER